MSELSLHLASRTPLKAIPPSEPTLLLAAVKLSPLRGRSPRPAASLRHEAARPAAREPPTAHPPPRDPRHATSRGPAARRQRRRRTAARQPTPAGATTASTAHCAASPHA